MAAQGLSEKIRAIASEKYVKPAIRAGMTEFSIRVRDLIEECKADGVPTEQKTPQFCTSIQKESFLEGNGLEIVAVDGPPSKLSTTVVVRYRVLRPQPVSNTDLNAPSSEGETPKERAFRLTEKLRGLMKEEISAHGGTEGFIRWVRSDEEDAA